jgi:hypothetical protein
VPHPDAFQSSNPTKYAAIYHEVFLSAYFFIKLILVFLEFADAPEIDRREALCPQQKGDPPGRDSLFTRKVI